MADPIAFTRFTRTPIYNEPLAGSYGVYDNDKARFADLLSSLPLLSSVVKPSKRIVLDLSNSSKHPLATSGHEQIHALLDSIESKLPEANDSNPFYQKIADSIKASGMGDPNFEAPAYVRTPQDLQNFSNPQFNVSSDFFTNYKNQLIQSLIKIDPKIAATYKTITGASNQLEQ